MLKIVPLCTALLAMPVAVAIIKPHVVPAKPLAFHVTPDLIPTKMSAAKQAGSSTDTDSLKNSSWYAEAMKNLAKKEYEFKPVADEGGYVTPNRQNNLHFTYSDKGFTVKPQIPVDKKDWKIAFNLNKEQIGEGEWQVAGNTAEYVTGNITVQYINNEDGMRQNFIVKEPTTAGEDEKIVLDIATALQVKVQPNGLQFANKQGVVMNYDQLKAWDANGQPLEATFEKSSRDYCIHVQSKNAVYPITIDPLSATPATTIKKNQAYANLGATVASAGDINADGYSDVIIGAPQYSNDQTNEGVAFVYYGSATGINPAVSDMLEGNQAYAGFASVVGNAGDVNGDGYSDVVVSAPQFETDGNTSGKEGLVLIFYGSPTGITILGPTVWGMDNYYGPSGAQFGYSASTAGDVNGDGYSDIIVGAPFWESNDIGILFIFKGGPGGLVTTAAKDLYIPAAPNNYRLGMLVGCAGDVNSDGLSDMFLGYPSSNVSIIHGSTTFDLGPDNSISMGTSAFGHAMNSAGDVNGDGYCDLIVGAPNYSAIYSDAGMVDIYYGTAAGINAGIKTRITCSVPDARFGRSVASAGDINGDGYSDIIVGAPALTGTLNAEGAAFVYYGSAAGISVSGVTVGQGNQAAAQYGSSVASAGDVNGDGFSDVIVGAPAMNNPAVDEGTVYVYHGSPSGVHTAAGFYVESNSNEARMGHSVAYAGDVNGDGYGDVVIGLPGYTNGQAYEGAIHVYHGTATGMSTTPAIVLEMNQANSSLGCSVAGAGDVNGDGYADIIVGAVNYSNGNTTEGMFRIYHGSATGITGTPAITVEGNQNSAQLGFSVACAGDVNGDGFSDVIVGASGYTNDQTNEGVAFLYHGSATGINATPAATLESNQTGSLFGVAVGSAGDVNGDGFSDVIVGAKAYTNDQTTEGAAFLYQGSATGINTATPILLEGAQGSAEFGYSVTGGDVNGDGYSDVIVGSKLYSNVETQEGRLYVYTGSAAGISTTATTTVESNMPLARLGSTVSICDVNSDGYIDVVAGAIRYSNAETDEGAVFVYYGSAAGLNSTANTIIESNVASANFGWATGAGDINGDGFSDVVVGAPALANNALITEGAVYAFYGNGAGKRNNLALYNTDLTTRVTRSNISDGNVGIGLFAKPFLGRTKGKLVWETSRSFDAYSGTPITNSVLFTSQQNSYTDLGLAGTELKALVTKLSTSRYTKIRARIKYAPVIAFTGQVYSPWRYVNELVAGLSLGTLPVNLVSFRAEWLQKGSTAQVKFITENEDGVCCYEVEKSPDGVQFTLFGKLTAKNTGTRNNYSYTDNNATAPKQYYRLKTIFQDGSVEYSNLQWLQSNSATEVIVFPNPASTVLQLRLNNNYASMNVQIMNAAGQTIQQYTNMSTAGQVITIPVSNLAAGSYFLYLQSGSEKQVLQFMKK